MGGGEEEGIQSGQEVFGIVLLLLLKISMKGVRLDDDALSGIRLQYNIPRVVNAFSKPF